MSAGADTKANTLELVRVPSSLLQRFQRGVALEALRESGSSFRAEAVARETASMGAGSGAEGYQWALTEGKHLGAVAHSNEVTALPLSPSHSAMMPFVVATRSRRR